MFDTEFLALRRVIEITGVSKSEIYRLMSEGKFPASHGYRHSPRRRFCVSHDVQAWQQQQLDQHVPELHPVPTNEFDELLITKIST